jgi:hypothetical protein
MLLRLYHRCLLCLSSVAAAPARLALEMSALPISTLLMAGLLMSALPIHVWTVHVSPAHVCTAHVWTTGAGFTNFTKFLIRILLSFY